MLLSQKTIKHIQWVRRHFNQRAPPQLPQRNKVLSRLITQVNVTYFNIRMLTWCQMRVIRINKCHTLPLQHPTVTVRFSIIATEISAKALLYSRWWKETVKQLLLVIYLLVHVFRNWYEWRGRGRGRPTRDREQLSNILRMLRSFLADFP